MSLEHELAMGLSHWVNKLDVEVERHEKKMEELYENLAIGFYVDLKQYIAENNLDFSGLGLKILAGMGTQVLVTADNKNAIVEYEWQLRGENDADDWSDPRVDFCRKVADIMDGNPVEWRLQEFNGVSSAVPNVFSANWGWTAYLDGKVLVEKGG